MKINKKGSGEEYTPFSHFGMTTRVIFNPDGGCPRANVTLSTLEKGTGSRDEIHDSSDQIFYMIKGSMVFFSAGERVGALNEGDAILVRAGEPHSVINEREEQAVYFALTVPPLEKTH